jgi:NAD(P)-dependent dehydrogenase (short-subunit alcohol dehydrogenase family)
MMLSERVVIVTGAGQGLGRAEALALAAEGARVVVGDADVDAGTAVVAQLVDLGARAVFVAGDVALEQTAADLVAAALDTFGRLDALVNNAGFVRDRSLLKMTAQEWDDVTRVHLRGHFVATQAACRHWRASGSPGRIVCTSSTAGLWGNFGQANYGAAKGGIATFSATVAWEMARYGVTCNAIAPSARTRMTAGLFAEPVEGEFDYWAAENVTPLVSYLCSQESAGVSGKLFGVQGDSVELFQPATVVAEIRNDGRRWAVGQLPDRVAELFRVSGTTPLATDPMARLAHSPSATSG